MNRFAFIAALALAGCATRPSSPASVIDPDAIARHVETLASDAYEGRAPGTAGEKKTLAYIVAQMTAAGLRPGNGSSWFHDVPLVEIAPSSDAVLTVEGKEGGAAFEWGEDAVILNPQAMPDARLDRTPIVFAGYGIGAPERGWDDFAGADLRGKTVVVLAGVPDPLKDAAQLGTTSAKVAEAVKRGASGFIVLLPSDLSDERWGALVEAERRPDIQLDGKPGAPLIEARLRETAAERLFAVSGHDYADLRAAAGKPGFRPVALGSRASVRLNGRVRRFASKNIVGVLPGTKRPDEYVLFLAHWDHFGRCAPGKPDPICNGAVDNASGVGGLIELARAFGKGKRPQRSIMFLATTAEEHGLLGAYHYIERPVVPLAKMVGGLGADTIASGGAPADVVVLGQGLSPGMDRLIAEAAKAQGRKVVADSASEAFFQRSDHYPFATAGVPVLIATSVFAPEVRAQTDKFLAERYHKPEDEHRSDLRFDGAALDIDLAYRVGMRLANSRERPGWKPGTPYAVAHAKQR